MNPPQIDDYISTNYLRYLGAIKTFAARSQFYAAFPQFVMIATLFYYGSDLAQSIFPTIYSWVAFLGIFGIITVVFEYTVVYPSQITFNAGQEARENRNPGYREIMRLHRRVDELEPHIKHNTMQTGSKVVVNCPECNTRIDISDDAS